MLAQVTEAIDLFDVKLMKRDFFQCRQHAIVVLGPLHDFGHLSPHTVHTNGSASSEVPCEPTLQL